jgi:spoIIIJ-associated protein
MKRFEAKSLEEVYELASNEFSCSITQLEIEIEQQPSKGFLGFGKKNAIISVSLKRAKNRYEKKPKEQRIRKKDIKIEEVSKKIEDSNRKDEQRAQKKRRENKKREPKLNEVPKVESKEKIFDNFYNESKSYKEPSSSA